jgi:biotin-dependent carboxylase-like uncharacterized protein
MSDVIMRVLSPGFGATVQDRGRFGWRRFGVPPSGFMDEHAGSWANRVLDNPPSSPVLELVLQGASLEILQDVWIAITGADAGTAVSTWRTVRVRKGERIEFPRNRSGLWTYLAVEGGFSNTKFLGSASACMRAGFGANLKAGETLSRIPGNSFQLLPGVAGHIIPLHERREYEHPPPLRVWSGPQWGLFSRGDRERFFHESWTVSSESNRVGYRLVGAPLASTPCQILSEPVRIGTIQVPENGLPIVTMRDGPTVGGYPKIGVVNPRDLDWLAQCRPGQRVQFQPIANET